MLPRLRLLVVVLALAALAHAAAPTGEPVKLGFFMSVTGRDASFGEAALRGSRLAVDDLNAAGGIFGRPVELVVEDNRSLPGESATAAKKLIARDKVIALIGECASARTLEAAPIAQAAGIPLVTPASTNPKVTAVGDCIFRVCFADPFQGAVLATYAWKNLGLRRAAPDRFDGPLLCRPRRRLRQDLHGPRRGNRRVAKYSGDAKDFRAQLTAIRSTQADTIFLPGYYVAAGLVAQQARELGLRSTLLGGDGFEAPQLIEIGAPPSRGPSTRPTTPPRAKIPPHAASSRPTGPAMVPHPSASPRSATTPCNSSPTPSDAPAAPSAGPSKRHSPPLAISRYHRPHHPRRAPRRHQRRRHHDGARGPVRLGRFDPPLKPSPRATLEPINETRPFGQESWIQFSPPVPPAG